MIGDGMGITQITAGMIKKGLKLNLERIMAVGLHKNFAYDNLTTDSAAGATAIACGVTTYNNAIGVGPDTLPRVTLLELAEQHGMPTGLLATSTLTHATPGSFIAHQAHRKMDEEIAADFMKTEVDLMIGGGRAFFQRRKDGRDLITELLKRNYAVFDFVDSDIKDIKADYTKNFAFFTADSEPLPFSQGRDYLVPATEFSLNFLDKKAKDKGFFIMIEGSQIDWGGHANQADYLISEMVEFDDAIGKVLDFAARDGETLVIITADHECGAMSILNGSTLDSMKINFASDYHTPDMIPVFAYGPGAEQFTGIYQNTAIFFKVKALMGWK